MRIFRTNNHRAGGFTLVETLVVLAIIGVVLAAALPLYSGLAPRLRIASASQELLADLRLARNEAVTEKTVATVTFHSAPSEYFAAGHRHRLPVRMTVQLRDEAPDGAENASLQFYRDGSADQ